MTARRLTGTGREPWGSATTWKPRAAAMSEQQLEGHMRKIAADIQRIRPGSLLAYHTHDSRRSAGGFPDWTFAGVRGVMFRELKTARGTVRPEQWAWIHQLRRAGADVAIWRPHDLEAGRIVWELARVAGLGPAIPASELKSSPAAESLIARIMEDE